jgi:hypothetical protein
VLGLSVGVPVLSTGAFTVTADGVFEGNCGQLGSIVGTTGTEHLYRVTVPTGGPFTLIVRTDVTETPGGVDGVDTVVYVRSVCTDPASELRGYCSDDAADADARSRVEIEGIPAGDYTIFVEPWGGVPDATSPAPRRSACGARGCRADRRRP